MSIGNALRARRDELGIPHKVLALEAGMRPTTLGAVFNGRSGLSFKSAQKLASLLNVIISIDGNGVHVLRDYNYTRVVGVE